jgi:hypothetical protein
MAQSPSETKTPDLFLSPEFQDMQGRSFAMHRATPEVTVNQYCAIKDLALKQFLSSRQIIFFDTNHWINLRHVKLKSPLQKVEYVEMLQLLEKLHGDKRICCPNSFLLFEEMMKQSDAVTRFATIRLVDQFSDGVCMAFPLELAHNELRHFLLQRIPRLNMGAKPWVWTKVGFIGGQMLPTVPQFDDANNTLMQKAWIDFMWDISVEKFLSINPNWVLPRTDAWDRYAAQCNQVAANCRSSTAKYTDALQQEKARLLRELLREELEPTTKEILRSFPEFADPKTHKPVSQADYRPLNFPSLQILAGIVAANMISSMKFEANDMLDFHHTATAVPYCDAVCCDHPMAICLKNKPCEFGKVYGTKIFGKPSEINSFLKSLG